MFKQIFAVVGMNLRNLPQRWVASLVTVIGIGAVVAVMVSLLAISAGLIDTASKTAGPDRVVVLSSGATAAYMGSITREQADVIADGPGVARWPDGKPRADPQATVIVEVTRKSDGAQTNTGIVGSKAEWVASQPNFKMVAGRMYRPAVRELIAGKNAARDFKDLAIGNHIKLRGSDWLVVGTYTQAGGLGENGIVGDTDTVLAAFERNTYSNVAVQLTSGAAFQRFADALKSDPRIKVEVKLTSQYAKDQVAQLTTILNFLGYFVGAIMAVGAVFGAINTMYSAVDSRTREIATLRAIGFGGFSVLVSVMVEALLIAFVGALIGALIAWVLFNGNSAHIASLTFPVKVTPPLVVLGIIFSLVIGLIGGFMPSIKAARLPVATALRAT